MPLWIRLKRDRVALLCMGFLSGVLVLGLLAPMLPLPDPTLIDIRDKFAPWSWHHPFGTDQLGRDLLAPHMYAIRAAVFLSRLTMAIAAGLGASIGLVAGFFRNRIDDVLMRICDVMMSFPSEVMILAIVGMMGPGLENVVIANVAAKWPWYARMIRSIVRQHSDKDYIRFAKVAGGSSIRIMMRHLLPGTAGELFVLTTLDTGSVILMISALSFLGLGVQPPTPEWGMMLNEAKEVMTMYPLQMIPAGMAILLVVAAFNFLGDSLRDALDPKYVGRERS